jgi:uncharacterized protein
MPKQLIRIAGVFFAALILIAPVRAQSLNPDPEAAAAARELVDTIKLGDQFKAILPTIFQHLKPAFVQKRPEVERDFDAMMPVLQDRMGARIGELMDAVVLIYALNFTAAELRDLTAFYHTPAGQKFLQKTPIITQQTMLAGQKFGQSAGAEAEKQMLEELRKKGHAL